MGGRMASHWQRFCSCHKPWKRCLHLHSCCWRKTFCHLQNKKRRNGRGQISERRTRRCCPADKAKRNRLDHWKPYRRQSFRRQSCHNRHAPRQTVKVLEPCRRTVYSSCFRIGKRCPPGYSVWHTGQSLCRQAFLQLHISGQPPDGKDWRHKGQLCSFPADRTSSVNRQRQLFHVVGCPRRNSYGQDVWQRKHPDRNAVGKRD